MQFPRSLVGLSTLLVMVWAGTAPAETCAPSLWRRARAAVVTADLRFLARFHSSPVIRRAYVGRLHLANLALATGFRRDVPLAPGPVFAISARLNERAYTPLHWLKQVAPPNRGVHAWLDQITADVAAKALRTEWLEDDAQAGLRTADAIGLNLGVILTSPAPFVSALLLLNHELAHEPWVSGPRHSWTYAEYEVQFVREVVEDEVKARRFECDAIDRVFELGLEIPYGAIDDLTSRLYDVRAPADQERFYALVADAYTPTARAKARKVYLTHHARYDAETIARAWELFGTNAYSTVHAVAVSRALPDLAGPERVRYGEAIVQAFAPALSATDAALIRGAVSPPPGSKWP